jgi:hypothetical protein
MLKFLLLGWQLINKSETTLDHRPRKILRKNDGKNEDWDTEGDDVSDIPFDP